MADNASFDTSELTELGNQIKAARARMQPEINSALRLSGEQVAARARRNLRTRGRYTKHYPRSITSTFVANSPTGMAARPYVEIGPEVGRNQGALGSILEHGSATSPPFPHLIPAAREQEPILQGVLARIALRSIAGR